MDTDNIIRELERYNLIRKYYMKHPYRMTSKNEKYFFYEVLNGEDKLFNLVEKIIKGKTFQKSLRSRVN